MTLTLLTRPDCGLCEEFEAALRTQRPDLAIAVADVDSREDWRRRWGLKIPVLLADDGSAVCVTTLDPDALAAL